MPLPVKTKTWIERVLSGSIQQLRPQSGGCINQSFQIEMSNGERYFIKYHPDTAMFAAEAYGLEAINAQVSGFAPKAIAWSDDCLILDWLQPAAATGRYWQTLGERLAALHQQPQTHFGFNRDNFCGATPQPNPKCDDGFAFFGTHRLRFQAELALKQGRLNASEFEAIVRLSDNLKHYLPEQPPVLIHGDLWSGNAMNTESGAAIFDPATHYGWAEAELAMTTLFGGFDTEFYSAYEATSSIAPDWRERIPIYNLYHLLNHLNLFGASYRQSVQQIIRRYA